MNQDSIYGDLILNYEKNPLKAVLESTLVAYEQMLNNPVFIWNNTCVQSSPFEILFYKDGDGVLRDATNITNVLIHVRTKDLYDSFNFKIIDIFNDAVVLGNEVNYANVSEIVIPSFTEIDEGYVFQQKLLHEVMPFDLEHMMLIKQIASMLKDDIHREMK